jgi:hypothetical protein
MHGSKRGREKTRLMGGDNKKVRKVAEKEGRGKNMPRDNAML